MKKTITSAVAALVTGLATMTFATSASALCVFGCGPAPAPVSSKLNFSLTANTLTSGMAGSQALGDLTKTTAGQGGVSDSFVNIGGFGNLCGSKCADGNWSANAMASHWANTSGYALSGGLGGSQAMTLGETGTSAGANLLMMKK